MAGTAALTPRHDPHCLLEFSSWTTVILCPGVFNCIFLKPKMLTISFSPFSLSLSFYFLNILSSYNLFSNHFVTCVLLSMSTFMVFRGWTLVILKSTWVQILHHHTNSPTTDKALRIAESDFPLKDCGNYRISHSFSDLRELVYVSPSSYHHTCKQQNILF